MQFTLIIYGICLCLTPNITPNPVDLLLETEVSENTRFNGPLMCQVVCYVSRSAIVGV